MTTTSVNQFTSSLLLTVMSADRYVAVCHPISSTEFRTPRIAKAVAVTAWAASFLMIVPVVMYAQANAGHAAAAATTAAVSSAEFWNNTQVRGVPTVRPFGFVAHALKTIAIASASSRTTSIGWRPTTPGSASSAPSTKLRFVTDRFSFVSLSRRVLSRRSLLTEKRCGTGIEDGTCITY